MSDTSGDTPGSGSESGTFGVHPVAPEASQTQSAVMEPPPPSGPGAPPAGVPRPHGGAGGPRRGGIVFGVVLIGLGMLMLFGRYAPWLDILRLWPLLIVAGGVAGMVRPRGDARVKRIAESAGTVVVGLVLLGNSFGVIQWGVWLNMLALWPMLLVALGIELLGRGIGSDWVRALSNVLLILTLLYGVFVMGPGWTGSTGVFLPVSGAAASFEQHVAHDADAPGGEASIHVGATRLFVGAGDQLASISGRAAKGTEPTLQHSVINGRALIEISDPSQRVVVAPYPDRSLDVTLDRAVAWDKISLDAGAADAKVDLRDLKVSNVTAGIGATNLTLHIGSRANTVTVDISGGAAAVTIFVPASASVVAESQAGLSAVNVPSTWSHESGIGVLGSSRWTSKGSGGPDIRIEMRTGVSSLDIRTY